MTLEELQAELYQNITEYLDVNGLEDYVSDLCDVVDYTFDTTFFAGKPLDKSPELALCLDCGNPAQVCLCEE